MSTPTPLLEEAMAHFRAGRAQEALLRLVDYTKNNGRDAAGWGHLAGVAHRVGDLSLAQSAVSRALELESTNTHLLLLAANVCQDQGNLASAVGHLEQAIRADPNFAQAHNNLGIIHRSLGRKDAAAEAFRAAVDVKPDYVRAWNNLGSTLMFMERGDEAAECFRKAIALDPGYAYAHMNLGLWQLNTSRFSEAEASLKRALELEPKLPEVHLALGRYYRDFMDLDRAELSFRKSLGLNQRGVDAILQLAEVLAEKAQLNDAKELYRRALDIQPTSLRARMGLALTLPQIYADDSEVDSARANYSTQLAALRKDGPALAESLNPDERLGAIQWNNFYLAYQGRDDRELQADFAQFQRRVLEPTLPNLYAPIAARSRSGRRLKVGFVSQFFYHCTAGNYFKSWITKLDRKQFETVVYSLNSRPDETTREIERECDHFRQPRHSMAGLAQAVRGEDLDVLIYPELGMHPRVFALASLRLAPLQCAGWGHPVTTGHGNIDVFFSSEAMEPPGAQAHYSERLVRLPGIGTCYPQPLVPEAVPRKELGLPEEATLYLFPQSLFKIHPDNDSLLVEILARDPRAVLVMFQSKYQPVTQQYIDRLSRRFANRGIATSGRVKMLPSLGHEDYLRVNLACDVMLDSLYWSGGNTSLDAIACGLPIVTRPGDMMRGRQSAGMLSLMGLEEMVVRSDEEYVELAVSLGNDHLRRAAVRKRLIENRNKVFDQETPIRALESFLLGAFPE